MPDDEIEPVVRALKRIKKERGYSLRGLARLLGFSYGHLSMVFNGKRRPGLRFMRAVAQRFPETRPIVRKSLDAHNARDRVKPEEPDKEQ